jgi:hypothetical protein
MGSGSRRRPSAAGSTGGSGERFAWPQSHRSGHLTANATEPPASIIAAQVRHADGGTLAQRVYIHQLPQTAPRLAGVIEGVFGPAARDGRAVSAGRRAEGKRREPNPAGTPDGLRSDRVSAAQSLCGRDRIRTCVGNAGDFTGRTAVSPWVPFHHHEAR